MEGKIIFVTKNFSEVKASILKDLQQKVKGLRLQNKVTMVVQDKLIVYEKEKGNIFEAQGDR